ncbi:MAG: CBS domain-containing protein [Candidatus Aenigmarchaeota archaeon]|nr:CBS domain-containing protein [Candidatus Aenigmarchaeota archaeon]
MKVSDVMSRNLKTTRPEKTIREAAKIMNRYRIGSLVVVSGVSLSGIITERDILKAFASGMAPGTKVEDVMASGVVTVGPDESLQKAAELMSRNGIKRLPVAESGQCVGMVTVTDLILRQKKFLSELRPLLSRKRKTLDREKKR